jgi:hypothetical protein
LAAGEPADCERRSPVFGAHVYNAYAYLRLLYLHHAKSQIKHVWSMDGQHLLRHLSVSFIPSANISFSTTKVVHHKLYKLLEQ